MGELLDSPVVHDFGRLKGCVGLVLTLAAGACGGDDAAADLSGPASTGSAAGSGTESSASSQSETSVSGVDGSSSTAAAETTDGGSNAECTLWADDCQAGLKCNPYSLEDDQIPDSVRCCAEADQTDAVGERCRAIDYNGSCLDTCERGSFCVVDVPDQLEGECRPYCSPGGNDCQPDETCKTFFELVPDAANVPLCMRQCDPLVQDCQTPNWRCIPDSPSQAGQSGFICVSPPAGPPVGQFGACALANQCEPGLVCISAERVPGCNFLSCCTPYCSLSEGDGACTALDPSLQCVDWMAPDPTWADVGACAIPD